MPVSSALAKRLYRRWSTVAAIHEGCLWPAMQTSKLAWSSCSMQVFVAPGLAALNGTAGRARFSPIRHGILEQMHPFRGGCNVKLLPSHRPVLCRYMASLYWTFTTISTTGYGDIVPSTIAERSFSMASMLLGLTVFSYFISSVSQAVEMVNAASMRSKEQQRVRACDLSQHRHAIASTFSPQNWQELHFGCPELAPACSCVTQPSVPHRYA